MLLRERPGRMGLDPTIDPLSIAALDREQTID